MSRADEIADLVDRWEAVERFGQAHGVDAFLAQEGVAVGSPVAVEARRRMAALSAMDRLLYERPRSEPHVEVEIRPGVEPVAGYVLERRIGVGGFGEVWRAIGPGGFPLALKLVRFGDKANVERAALNVAKMARHPNLIATYGAWERPGLLVIAMELADCTLYDRLQTAVASGLAGIPTDELIGYMRDAAGGLDHLNRPSSRSRGVQHRDVKPHNLLIVGGRVKVADFGNAKILADVTTEHTGRLSARYAAPEFFDGRTSRHSDQYGLAAVYVHLRTGRPVFPGDGAQLMRAHLDAEPDLTRLPVAERPVVAKALSKRPADRWTCCRAFVEALAEQSTAPDRPTIVVRREPHAAIVAKRESRAAIAFGFAGLLGVGLVVVVAFSFCNPTSDDLPSDRGGKIENASRSLVTLPAMPEESKLVASTPEESAPQAPTEPIPSESPIFEVASSEPAPQGPPTEEPAYRQLLREIELAVERSRLNRDGPVGPVGHGEPFLDEPIEPRYLVGLNLTTGKFGYGYRYTAIASVQPIYQTASGHVAGRVFGSPRSSVTTLVAAPGYAIGAIDVVPGSRIAGLRVRYDVVTPVGLDDAESYVSDWVGNASDASLPVVETVGSGCPIVGLEGVWIKELRALGVLEANLSP